MYSSTTDKMVRSLYNIAVQNMCVDRDIFVYKQVSINIVQVAFIISMR